MQLLPKVLYFLLCLGFSEGIFDFFYRIQRTIKYNTISRFYESCDTRWVTADFTEMEYDLYEKLFGQPLVADTIVNALRSHFYNDYRRKPLVMSFHGWTGGGKTYVTSFILKHMFKKGVNSRFIRKYNAKTHFPVEKKAAEYQAQLHRELRETISQCRHSIFIFDEVDKYPKGVLDAVKPYLNYEESIDGYDFRTAVFIFLTNNGQSFITNKALENLSKGIHRDDFALRDFEKILKQQSFNDEGGFYRSELIMYHLIDHYIPFLPLEKEHVTMCIEYEIQRQGGDVESLQDQINLLLEDLSFGPDGHEVFAVSGCKVVSEKVAFMLEKQKRATRLKIYKQKREL